MFIIRLILLQQTQTAKWKREQPLTVTVRVFLEAPTRSSVSDTKVKRDDRGEVNYSDKEKTGLRLQESHCLTEN